MLQWFEMSVTN